MIYPINEQIYFSMAIERAKFLHDQCEKHTQRYFDRQMEKVVRKMDDAFLEAIKQKCGVRKLP